MILQLYYKPTCPFCINVLNYIKENRISGVDLANVGTDPALREELARIGGKAQVPCLMINGKPLYESGDIIRWLDAHGRRS